MSPSSEAWTIRPARPADANAVADVLMASALAAWGHFLGRDRIVAANADRTHPADLVAADTEGLAAFVAWNAETGEITRLYTHPRAWGRGAATALLDRALAALRDGGCKRAWLNTEERNDAARRFYERRGWREDGPARVRDWHGARIREPRYVKEL